LPFKNKNLN